MHMQRKKFKFLRSAKDKGSDPKMTSHGKHHCPHRGLYLAWLTSCVVGCRGVVVAVITVRAMVSTGIILAMRDTLARSRKLGWEQ